MKKALSLFLVLVMALATAACSGGGTSAAAEPSAAQASEVSEAAEASGESGEQIEITFMTIWAPDFDSPPNRARAALIEQFEETHPNVKVVNNSIPQEEQLTKIVQLTMSDTLPDLFMAKNDQLTTMVENEAIRPVEEYFAMRPGWEEQFIPATFNDMKVNGTPYAFPYQWQGNAFLWCNQDIFEECGVPLPETMEDLMAAAPVFNEHGYAPVAWGNSVAEGFGVIVLNGVVSAYCDEAWLTDMLQNREPGKSWADNEGWVNAVQWVADAGQAGLFNSDTNSMTESDSYLLYAQEKAAAIWMGGWFAEWMETNASQEMMDKTVCRYIPLPENSLVPANSLCAGSSWGWQISKHCEGEKLEAVLDLAEMFTGEDYTKAALEQGFTRVPCWIPEDADFSKVGPLSQQYTLLTQDANPTTDYFLGMMPGDLMVAFGECYQSLLAKEMTVDQALEKMQQAYDTQL